MTLSLVLVVLALLCALAAAFNFAPFGPRTPNLTALALAFWFASLLIR